MAQGRFRRPKYTPTLVIATSTTVVSEDHELNGLLSEVLIKTPAAVDNSATVTVDIIDADGYTLFSKSGVAVNTRSVNLLAGDAKVPLAGKVTVRVTFSAAQSTAKATEVVLLVDRG